MDFFSVKNDKASTNNGSNAVMNSHREAAAAQLDLQGLPTTKVERYKYTDADGKTVFTNQPPTNVDAKPVELPPTNTVGPQAPIVPAVRPIPSIVAMVIARTRRCS